VLLKLTDDYTAANGSDIVLTSGAATGDILEFITFADFTVNNQNFTGGLTVDNDGSTVLTVDRATSDGTIIDVQKSGSSVGVIGTEGNDITIDGGVSNHSGLRFSSPAILPRYNGVLADNQVDLGQTGSNYRFKDLYLSGGVYLGGTGSANLLDSYEEGNFTPEINFSGNNSGITYTSREGVYTKVGRLVTCFIRITLTNNGSVTSGQAQFANLPFTVSEIMSTTAVQGSSILGFVNGFGSSYTVAAVYPWESTTTARIYYKTGANTGDMQVIAGPIQITNSFDCRFTLQYMTTA
jgi:hypothetical protein